MTAKKQPLVKIGRNALRSIKESLAALRKAEAKGRGDEEREAIYEEPLSLQVRSGWVGLGEAFEAEEFELLLCTGGPAVRIRGELSGGEPSKAILQVQDWFTPWTDVPYSEDAALEYASLFSFDRSQLE